MHFSIITVSPTKSTRWVNIWRKKDLSRMIIFAWTIGDLREIIDSSTGWHKPLHLDIQVNEVSLFISENQITSKSPGEFLFSEYWSEPSQSDWSEEAWAGLLQVLPSTWGMEWLQIHIPDTAPLKNLLDCLPHPHLEQRTRIIVLGGTVTMEDLEAWCQKDIDADGRITLMNIHIVVSKGRKEALRARRNKLLWPSTKCFHF